MGLTLLHTCLKKIGRQRSFRNNFGYRYYFDTKDAVTYKNKKQVKLKYVLTEIPSEIVLKGHLNRNERLVDIGNIERRLNSLVNLQTVSEVGSNKHVLQKGDIIIPKLQPRMGNIFLNTNLIRYIGSTELIEYRISDNYNPMFIYYLIISINFYLT